MFNLLANLNEAARHCSTNVDSLKDFLFKFRFEGARDSVREIQLGELLVDRNDIAHLGRVSTTHFLLSNFNNITIT